MKKRIVGLLLFLVMMANSIFPIASLGNNEKDADIIENASNTVLGSTNNKESFYDQQEEEECPENYTEEYKKWLELSDEEKSEIGCIPAKYYVPMETLVPNNTLLRKALVKTGSALPSSYILTGEDTNNDGIIDENDITADEYGNIPIKIEDQGNYQLCWAFASINSLETNLALNGYGNYDFSELHLDYINSNYKNSTRSLHNSGNFGEFIEYEEKGDGVVLETEAPYSSTYDTPEGLEYLKSLKQRARVKKYVEMPTIDKKNNNYYSVKSTLRYNYEPEELTDEILAAFRNNVKKHIMNNGSLDAAINDDDLVLSSNINKYVVNGKSNNENHAITIIGWDDNFSKENFPEEIRPKENGAYIALNTYMGSSNSYLFYISYEDYLVEFSMAGVEQAYITEPLSISIQTEPNKINYLEDEKFDKTGLVVMANYQDGSSKEITDYNVDLDLKELSLGDKYVTISYTEDETTQKIKQPINVYSERIECGDDIVALYNNYTKRLDFKGTGEMYDYNINDNTWNDIINAELITISDNITKIGKNIFNKFTNAKEILLLGKNYNIDNDFCVGNQDTIIYCPNESNIINVLSINGMSYYLYDECYECGENTFGILNNEDKKLIVDGIGDTYDFTTTNIPWKQNYSNITKIEVKKDVTSLGSTIFANNEFLKEVDIEDDVISIGENAFYCDNMLERIQLSSNLEKIDSKAFYGCSNITNIDLPESLERINESAFKDCIALKEIVIPGSIREIRPYSFQNCTNLEKLVIGEGIYCIGLRAFDNCVQLKTIEFPQNSLLWIGAFTFNHCISLENIELPYGMTQLVTDAFSECTNLKECIIPDSVTDYGNCVFRGDTGLEKVKFSKNALIPNGICQECTNLKEVIIPYGVEELMGNNFSDCTSLEYFKYPNSMKKIGDGNFFACSSLKKIIIPKSVTQIGKKSYFISDDVVIYCTSDSKAKQYAIENNYNYIEDNIAPTITSIEKTEIENKKIRVNIEANDDNEEVGVDIYSFDGGITWQEENYKDFSKNCEIQVCVMDSVGNISNIHEEKICVSNTHIVIQKMPNKTCYIAGQDFEANGMEVKVVDNNGEENTITDYTIENGTDLKEGQESVKITYEGMELNVPIVVYSKDNYDITFSEGMYSAISELLSRYIVYSDADAGKIRCIVTKEGIDNLTQLNISKINFGYADKADYTGLSKLHNLKELELNENNIYNQQNFFEEICQLGQLEQLKFNNCWFDGSYSPNDECITEVIKLPNLQLMDFGERTLKSGGWIEDRVCYLPKYLTKNDIESINVKCRYKSNTGENVFENLPIYEDENGYLYILLDTEVNEDKLYTSYGDSLDTGRMVEINISTEKIQQKINYYYDWEPETEKPTVEITAEPLDKTTNSTDSDTVTYTFTWNEKVYGFTKDSIMVENGEKGEFTEITPNQVYSLVVTNNVKDGQEVTQKITVNENVCEDLASNGNVKADKEITIDRKEDETLNVETEQYEIINEDTANYIEKILPNTSIEELKQQIETNGTIEIYKGEEKIANEESLLGTGMEIVVKLGEQEERYIAIVTGDLTGNGKMGIGDLTKLSRYAVGLDNNLSGAYLKASDIVKDGKYGTISDILKMSRVLAGLDSL